MRCVKAVLFSLPQISKRKYNGSSEQVCLRGNFSSDRDGESSGGNSEARRSETKEKGNEGWNER